MILFWFLLGLFIILCISRYNEDDKLFWKLLVSFVGTYAAATFVYKYIESQKQDKVEYYQSAPTQALYSGSHNTCVLADPSVTVTDVVAATDPVSKDIMIGYTMPILSEVYVETRGQPCEYFDTS